MVSRLYFDRYVEASSKLENVEPEVQDRLGLIISSRPHSLGIDSQGLLFPTIFDLDMCVLRFTIRGRDVRDMKFSNHTLFDLKAPVRYIQVSRSG